MKSPGCVSEGRHLKVSSGEMASRVVERVPMLSQPRYLMERMSLGYCLVQSTEYMLDSVLTVHYIP